MKISWIKFKDKIGPKHFSDPEKRQEEYLRAYSAWQGIRLPKERKYVLCRIAPRDEEGLPEAIAVGYLRYAAGDKSCPFFVIPGVGGQVTAYADCLPQDLKS